jgi:hypothetical protein
VAIWRGPGRVSTTHDDWESMTPKPPPRVKRAARKAAVPARRRRTADETRRILLDAATRVAISQMSPLGDGVSNLLAGVRITDALAEVNANHGLATKMTTGAAYHIWPDQAAFQLELLEHVMNAISIPGADEIERSVVKMIAAEAPADEIFAMVADADSALAPWRPPTSSIRHKRWRMQRTLRRSGGCSHRCCTMRAVACVPDER